MCLNCPGGHLPDTPENRALVQKEIRAAADKVDEIIKGTNNVEDVYRKAAVFYHGTLMAARQQNAVPPVYSSSRLEKCKALFELTDASEYEVIFKPFHDAVAALVDFRSRHFRYSGTMADLCHRIHVDINPRLGLIIQKVDQFRIAIDESLEYAKDLDEVSEERFHGAGQGAWYRPTNPLSRPFKLMTTGPEWVVFRNWLLCLPETPRAIAAGQSLLDHASQVMYDEEDGLMPGFWGAIGEFVANNRATIGVPLANNRDTIGDSLANNRATIGNSLADNRGEDEHSLQEWDEDRGVWLALPSQIG